MATIIGSQFDDDIDGTIFDDDIYGRGGDDRLWGYEGDDFLIGGSGNDELDGGSGWDYMEGGTGDDLYVVGSHNDEVVEFAGEGAFDVVYTFLPSYTLDPNVEDLTAIGDGDFFGTGNGLDNFIHGFFGDDTLDGAGGADTLFGEVGDDAYYIDQRGDRAVERAGEGYDYVFTSLPSLTLFANVEELIFDGPGDFVGNGNGLGNYIGASGGDDVLSGRGGDDLIEGFGGADRLNGGTGRDIMRGGNGNDLYIVDNSGDRAVESSASGGFDQVRSMVSFRLGAHVENLTLAGSADINGFGNGDANAIAGNIGDNLLAGGAGNDRLNGGGGNDSLFGGFGNDRMAGGAGADRYYFNTELDRTLNVDAILDFSTTDDRIMLDRSVFGAIGANGVLAADAFHTGISAGDAEDRIVYDQATGRIFYDADGAGGAAQILFARVDPGLDLSNTDFAIYG